MVTGAIRQANEALILGAGERVFARAGFNGATMAAIADEAGLPKANLHYYFGSKAALYQAVLARTLRDWLVPLDALQPGADPARALADYIRAKMAMSAERPDASRVFANELLHGAAVVGALMRGELRDKVQLKAAVIDGWVTAGRMAPVDATHLFFTIWAATQTYADFEAQVAAARAVHGSFGCHDLMSVLIGANDVIDLFENVYLPNPTSANKTAVLNELTARGARLGQLIAALTDNNGPNFIVSTAPLMNLTPYAAQMAIAFPNADVRNALHDFSENFNTALRVNIPNDGSRWGLVELDALRHPPDPVGADPFSRERRLELRQPQLAAELGALMPGYAHTPAAALALLEAMARRGAQLNGALVARIRALAG